MPKAYSADMRERVIAEVEGGASRREAAEEFEVSASTAIIWVKCFRETGRCAAKPRGEAISDAASIYKVSGVECSSPCRFALFFLHGFSGNPDSTWGEGSSSWPTLVASDPALGSRMDVYKVRYTSSWFSHLNMGTIVAALGSKLDAKMRENKYEKVVLIAHSLGGNVSRNYLNHVKLTYGHTALSRFPLVRCERVRFVQADAQVFPFEPASFDAARSNGWRRLLYWSYLVALARAIELLRFVGALLDARIRSRRKYDDRHIRTLPIVGSGDHAWLALARIGVFSAVACVARRLAVDQRRRRPPRVVRASTTALLQQQRDETRNAANRWVWRPEDRGCQPRVLLLY